jgi:hypothetical protein
MDESRQPTIREQLQLWKEAREVSREMTPDEILERARDQLAREHDAPRARAYRIEAYRRRAEYLRTVRTDDGKRIRKRFRLDIFTGVEIPSNW